MQIELPFLIHLIFMTEISGFNLVLVIFIIIILLIIIITNIIYYYFKKQKTNNFQEVFFYSVTESVQKTNTFEE